MGPRGTGWVLEEDFPVGMTRFTRPDGGATGGRTMGLAFHGEEVLVELFFVVVEQTQPFHGIGDSPAQPEFALVLVGLVLRLPLVQTVALGHLLLLWSREEVGLAVLVRLLPVRVVHIFVADDEHHPQHVLDRFHVEKSDRVDVQRRHRLADSTILYPCNHTQWHVHEGGGDVTVTHLLHVDQRLTLHDVCVQIHANVVFGVIDDQLLQPGLGEPVLLLRRHALEGRWKRQWNFRGGSELRGRRLRTKGPCSCQLRLALELGLTLLRLDFTLSSRFQPLALLHELVVLLLSTQGNESQNDDDNDARGLVVQEHVPDGSLGVHGLTPRLRVVLTITRN